MTLPSLDTSGRSSRTGAFDFEAAPRFLIYTGRAITLIAITIAPWLFGCVRAQEQVWLYSALTAAAVIASIVVIIRAIKTPEAGSLRFPLLAIPMIAGIGLGAIQLLPGVQELTTSHVTQSPELAQWDLGEPIKSTRYSFYPHFTMLEIVRYTFATVAFFLGYILFRSPVSQRLLWSCLLGNGLVLVIFGLIQKFTWNGKLFWNVVLTNGGDPFASFVNRNNAMAYLYIVFAAGIGLLVWSIDRRPVRATKNFVAAVAARVASLEPLQVGLVVCLAVLASGVVASTSRSGALSAGTAGILVLIFAAVRRRSAWPLVVAAVAISIGAVGVLTLQIQDQLADRISRVDTDQLDQRMRFRHAKDALQVTNQLPVLGSGLGTHRYAYLPFVTEFGRFWAVNADNQYVETAVEGGIFGLVVVALIVLFSIRLLSAGRKMNVESAGTLSALLFLISSQGMHAVFDFGITLPATLVAACLLLGTAVAAVSSRTGGSYASFWSGTLALPAVAVGLLALSAGGLSVCRGASRVEKHISMTAQMDKLSDKQLEAAIEYCDELPGAEILGTKSRLLIERYERKALIEIERVAPGLSLDRKRALSSLSSLFITVQRLRATGQSNELQMTRQSPAVVENLGPALASLRQAVRLCPILPGTYSTAARLAAILEGTETAGKFARRAVLLEPYDDKVTTSVGSDLLEIASLRPIGESFLRHGLSTERWRVQRDVIEELDTRYGAQNILDEICPRSGFAAIRLARQVNVSLKARVLEVGLTAERNGSSLESLLSRAEINRELGDQRRSLELCQEAVSQYPGSAEAHFHLANAFRANGDLAAALVSVRAAAVLDPDGPGYVELLNKIESGITGNGEPPQSPETS